MANVYVGGTSLNQMISIARLENLERDRMADFAEVFQYVQDANTTNNFGILENGISPRGRDLSDMSGDVFAAGVAFQIGYTT